MDVIVLVAFILIESILKILNLVSKNVFRKEIPKKTVLYHCPCAYHAQHIHSRYGV